MIPILGVNGEDWGVKWCKAEGLMSYVSCLIFEDAGGLLSMIMVLWDR